MKMQFTFFVLMAVGNFALAGGYSNSQQYYRYSPAERAQICDAYARAERSCMTSCWTGRSVDWGCESDCHAENLRTFNDPYKGTEEICGGQGAGNHG